MQAPGKLENFDLTLTYDVISTAILYLFMKN